jgi:hypothetical protein
VSSTPALERIHDTPTRWCAPGIRTPPSDARIGLSSSASPGEDLVRSGGEIGLIGDHAQLFWRAITSARTTSQPASNLPLYLSDHLGA